MITRIIQTATLIAAAGLLHACGDAGHSQFDHCGHDHGNAASADGHTHDAQVVVEAYSQRHEAYAKCAPFVAGQASSIELYISKLKDFKPLDSAKVTVSMVIGSQGIRQTLERPSRPGVYATALTPGHTGDATLWFDIEAGGQSERLTAGGLKVFDNEHDAHAWATERTPSSPNAVTFTKEQSWIVDFATEITAASPATEVITATGQVQTSLAGETILAARTSGTVSIAAGLAQGSRLKAGAVVCHVDGRTAAENNTAARRTQLEGEYLLAKSELERMQALADDSIVTAAELQRAQLELRNAKAAYDNLNNAAIDGVEAARMPADGYLARLLAANGQFVEAGEPLASYVIDNQQVIKVMIPPRHWHRLAEIRQVTFRTTRDAQARTLDELGGRLLACSPAGADENPMVPVTFALGQAGGLVPGEFVEARIAVGDAQGRQAVTVPREAVVEEMGSHFVFTQITPELFDKTPVELGASDGRRVAITAGLDAGRRIVARGAAMVRLAQGAAALDAHSGHVH